MQSLRGLYLAKELTAERVGELAARLPELAIRKVEVGPLLGRIWELKDNLTPDDAAYVAVAEQFGVPLVTADLRLMRASGRAARSGGSTARPGEPGDQVSRAGCPGVPAPRARPGCPPRAARLRGAASGEPLAGSRFGRVSVGAGRR
ncbi:type II toxin-antitoxin system VapC family toxin [Kitasatospora aburaviensis]